MKKIIVLGMLVLTVAACDKSSCTSETCKQCADACVMTCVEKAGEGWQKKCHKTCQCTCHNIENGAQLADAVKNCL